ncbi:Elongator complex protein 5 [Xylaria sp. CBS 124048]|nr:Elongator complex protein 5 [Xylaria sp. CBS 124048]
MAPSTTQSHARSHALLLLQKLLNLRDSASPLTLVLDTLEQSGRPILREFMTRARISKSKLIYISFATPRRPAGVDAFVRARGKNAESLRSEIASHYPSGHTHKTLVIIDELNPLSTTLPEDLALFLSSLIPTPSLSLVALYHTDVPLPLPLTTNSYTPHPLTVLLHLATAVLRVSNLQHAIERRRAQNRSLREPEFGLDEGREGVLIGLSGNDGGVRSKGLVLEMELRRRSGRSVAESFVVVPSTAPTPDQTKSKQEYQLSKICLLSEHPDFATPDLDAEAGREGGEDGPASTFDLSLTEKQRRDRAGIVLPYFDAQTDVGAGEGGRILYDLGREDDFDEEEDEI